MSRPAMIWSTALVSALSLCTLSMLLWQYWPRSTHPQEYTVPQVQARTHLCEHGVLASGGVTIMRANTNGILISVIENGTLVQKGDELFRSDTSELEQRQERLQLDAELARSELQVAQLELGLFDSNVSESRRLAEAEETVAQQTLDTQLSGLTPSQNRLLDIDIALGDLDNQAMQENLERSARLLERGLLATASHQALVRRAQTLALEQRERMTEAAIRRSGAKESDLVRLRLELERSVLRRSRLQENQQRERERLSMEVAVRQARIKKIETELQQVLEEIAQATCYAPQPGIAVVRRYRDWGGGGRMLDLGPGVQRWRGDGVVDIIDPTRMEVQVMINEADVSLIDQTNPVAIHLHAYPQSPAISGTMVSLAAISRDRSQVPSHAEESQWSGVAVYVGRILFESSQLLRPGMTATIHIPIHEPSPRLILPRSLVQKSDDGLYYVRVASGTGGSSKRAITGRNWGTDGFLVDRGIAPGDRLRWESAP